MTCLAVGSQLANGTWYGVHLVVWNLNLIRNFHNVCVTIAPKGMVYQASLFPSSSLHFTHSTMKANQYLSHLCGLSPLSFLSP